MRRTTGSVRHLTKSFVREQMRSHRRLRLGGYWLPRGLRRIGGHLIQAGCRIAIKTVYRKRSDLRSTATVLSYWSEKAMRGGGERLLRLAVWLDKNNLRFVSHVPLALVRYSLVLSAQAHLGARQYGRAIRTARILNLLFRASILNHRNPEAITYYQVLYHTRLYSRIAHDFKKPVDVTSYYLALIAGIAHLYLLSFDGAKHYLSLATKIERSDPLSLRMLGRAHLLSGDYAQAAIKFHELVALDPRTVMGHQNYAGRYDIHQYKPREWEQAWGGYLLVYDNLVQFAEDLFLQGTGEDSFRFYNKALTFQKELAEDFALPSVLLKWVQLGDANFDRNLPTRILAYEWVTQFGHIGLLDSYKKMSQLGMVPSGNHILLAPPDKVSNAHYLSYWEPHFTIIRSEALVNELFPYQRFIGDQFMALPGEGTAEPWTRAAAHANVLWAQKGRGPLLKLTEQDKHEGHWKLAKLGLPRGAWYVGLHVREGGFYQDGSGTISEHRSSNIEDYYGAIEEVTSRGGWVVRMGDPSMNPLPDMPNVIDYAHSDLKSEQMDIFLLATSRFVIGTTSGLSTVAMTFGTPMLLVNCISNDWQIWTEATDFMLKRVYDRRSGRYLSLGETYRVPCRPF